MHSTFTFKPSDSNFDAKRASKATSAKPWQADDNFLVISASSSASPPQVLHRPCGVHQAAALQPQEVKLLPLHGAAVRPSRPADRDRENQLHVLLRRTGGEQGANWADIWWNLVQYDKREREDCISLLKGTVMQYIFCKNWSPLCYRTLK